MKLTRALLTAGFVVSVALSATASAEGVAAGEVTVPPGASSPEALAKALGYLDGLWVSDVSQGQGELKTYCNFRSDLTFRCETMNLNDGAADFAYGKMEISQANDRDIVLVLRMDEQSPLTPGEVLSEVYRIVDHDTMKHMMSDTLIRRVR
ncbi:MAG: hypothetical protein PHP86_12605 [Nevskiales bacterium]|nr:hypothetical protein [Nevskiales bacterium]